MSKALGSTDAIHERRLGILESLLPAGWLSPMVLGGHSGSHHSGDLRYLVDRELAERRARNSWYTRASYLYRRTGAGTNYLEAQP